MPQENAGVVPVLYIKRCSLASARCSYICLKNVDRSTILLLHPCWFDLGPPTCRKKRKPSNCCCCCCCFCVMWQPPLSDGRRLKQSALVFSLSQRERSLELAQGLGILVTRVIWGSGILVGRLLWRSLWRPKRCRVPGIPLRGTRNVQVWGWWHVDGRVLWRSLDGTGLAAVISGAGSTLRLLVASVLIGDNSMFIRSVMYW